MNDEKVYLTKEALENFKKEFESLVEERRPLALERVAETRVVGELEENNEHIQAKQDLAFVDGRIAELEGIVAKASLIDEGHKNCQSVNLGCLVTVRGNGEKKIFQLVGEWEADPLSAKISHDSPLGQALLGKKVGEKVEIEAPVGKILYTILQID